MALGRDQIEQFHRTGFVALKNFIGRDDIGRVSAWLDDMQQRPPTGGAEAMYFEKSPVTGRNILVRIEHFLGPQNPWLMDLVVPPNAIECLTELLGEPPRLFKEKANYKLPGCRPDKLHQDQSAGWNAYSDFFISMAIVVDPNRRDNAALTFMSSGHYERRLMTPEWQPLTEEDPPYSPAGDYALIEADPGDVIFFDSYVPHGSPANTSDRSRRNVYVTFNRRSAGDMRDRYYAEKWASYPPNNLAEARESSTYRV